MADMNAMEDAAATERVRRVVTRYATAWAAGDFPAIRDCYHEQFTLHYAGNNPLSGVHKGRAACLAVLEEFRKRTRRKLLSVDHIMAGPDRGAVVAHEQFSHDGTTTDVQRLLVYTVLDDQLHECWVYDQDQALVDRLLS
ncbi:MAG: nuclear transport factor 2 family protein [Afipia sp.]